MLNKNRSILGSVFVLVVSLSFYLFWQGLTPLLQNNFLDPNQTSKIFNQENQILSQSNQSSTSASFLGVVKVIKVIDGDTIEVEQNGVSAKVRYIGVNTPETVDPRRGVQCFGKEASNENKRLVEGKEIILEKDISETDKYNRPLRYVYLKLDDNSNLFVNDYLVREGFANSSTYPPDVKFSNRFNQAQAEAKENNKGLWGSCK